MKRDTVILVVLLTLGSFSSNAQSSKSEKVIVDRSRLFNQAFLETRDSMMLNDLLSVKGFSVKKSSISLDLIDFSTFKTKRIVWEFRKLHTSKSKFDKNCFGK